MLRGKLKMSIFKEVVHEDDEFTHAGRHSDERFFTSAKQALIKFFEDAVITHGAERSHIECFADCPTATANGTETFLRAAVTIIGSNAGQSRCRLFIECPQLRHFRQDCRGYDWTDSGNALQSAGFVSQLRILGNECGNRLITLVDLFLQEGINCRFWRRRKASV